jgi:hypothetical protein
MFPIKTIWQINITDQSKMKFHAATWCAVLLMLSALAYLFALVIIASTSALSFPYGLDYGEGVVWQQAMLLQNHDAYGPINNFHSISFNYTPIYHALVLGVTALTNWDMLFTGRAISICATFMTIIMVSIIVTRAAPTNMPIGYRILVAATSGSLILSVVPIYVWGQLMRVDILALLFSLIGLV